VTTAQILTIQEIIAASNSQVKYSRQAVHRILSCISSIRHAAKHVNHWQTANSQLSINT